MKSTGLASQKQQIDSLFGRAEDLYRLVRDGRFRYEFEIQADLARYLCIRVCGLVDSAVNQLLAEYIDVHAPPKLARFTSLSLGRQQNLKANKLLELVAQFNLDWEKDLRQFLTEERKDALDSLVDNRNNIAHGRSTGITHARVWQYYRPVLEIIDFLETKCLA